MFYIILYSSYDFYLSLHISGICINWIRVECIFFYRKILKDHVFQVKKYYSGSARQRHINSTSYKSCTFTTSLWIFFWLSFSFFDNSFMKFYKWSSINFWKIIKYSYLHILKYIYWKYKLLVKIKMIVMQSWNFKPKIIS